MFKCAMTGKFSKPGEKAIRLVTERRDRFYFEQKAGVEDVDGKIVGQGHEIVSEVNVTLDGLKLWTTQHPEDTASATRYAELLRAEQNRKRNAIAKKPEIPQVV